MKKMFALGCVALASMIMCGCEGDAATKPTPTPDQKVIKEQTDKMKDIIDESAKPGGNEVKTSEPAKGADDATKTDAEPKKDGEAPK